MLDKRLLTEAKVYRHRFFKIIGLSIINAICIVLTAYELTKIIHGVFLEKLLLSEVVSPLAILLFVMSVKSIVLWLTENTAHTIAQQIKHDLRTRLLHHLLALGPITLAREQVGELINLLTEGIDHLDDYFTKFLPQIISTAILPLLILMIILPIDYKTALILLFTAPLIPIFMILIGKRADKENKKQWQTLSNISAYFLDVIEGLTTLKILNQSIAQIKKIETLSNEFRDITLKVLRIAFLSALILELVATLSVALVAVTVGLRLLNDNITFSTAFFLLLIAPEFYLPLRQLGTAFHASMAGTTAADHIYQVLKNPVHKSTAKDQKVSFHKTSKLGIAFENVSFSYLANQPVLNEINFAIAPGEHVAIVGASGAGKTTLFHLLLNFIQPQSGKILINHTDLSSIEQTAWLKNIAYVPQAPHIFAQTVAENIAMANTDATFQEIEAAAKAAMAHDFIQQLPLGYQTMLGEGGHQLSGGQMRRIAIARAFLQNAPLILLDEATSGLDVNTEADVTTALHKLTKEKTVLIIAHRLRSVETADKIIVMQHGQVLEIGSHDELLQQRGAYFTLLMAYRGEL
ncbi:thiol reductant ABC exporter subunit CydD [Anaerosinus massiliensis]|uniref:thiol reductant ABC exporter subunit CydD n=1 Tax=Massilibacillus massiliensis TaxID=1806837 RepID=UPI000B2DBDF1|nr:thiol reductant ABC exporter subunit CydD [Massilibacillus massiliensis]